MPRSNLSLEDWCYNNDCLGLLNHLVNKNDRLISFGSHKEIDWICDLNHKFSIDPCKFTNPHRCQGNIGVFKCPYCNGQKVLVGFNDLATTRPDLASEWDYSRNDFTPQEVTKGSHKDAWWLCKNNHSWKARISARDYRNGCPYCADVSRTSKPEQLIYLYAKKYFPDTLNMYSVDGMSLDIYVPSRKIAIEYDGSYWHSLRDTSYKFDKCRQLGIELYKISGLDSDNENTYVINDNSLNLSVFPNDLTNAMQKLFKKAFGVDLDFSEYSSFVIKAMESFTSNSVLPVTDEMKKRWSDLNGYDIVHIRNDWTSKYWVCDNGHTFKRRYDVISRSGFVCPFCKKLGNHNYYLLYNIDDIYIIYDKSENSIEALSHNDIVKALDLGYNIGCILKYDGDIVVDYTPMINLSFSGIRNII